MSERRNELMRRRGGGEAGAAPGAMQHAAAGDGVTVIDNQQAEQYEARVEGMLSFMAYERQGDRIVLVHTEVRRALEGQGIAAALARAALEDARARDLVVAPLCPFVAGYIRRHQEYLPLVAPDYQARLRTAASA